VTAFDEQAGASEQTRRIAECWHESAPTSAEIRRARARIGVRVAARPGSRFRVLAIALGQGFVLGGVTLAAAAWVGHALPGIVRGMAAGSASERTLPAPPRRGAPASVREPTKAEADSARAAAVAVFGDASEAPVAPAHERTAARAGSPARLHAEAAPPAAAASGVAAVAPAPSEAPSMEEVAGTTASGPWARVARALSASDWLRADEALVELSATSDPATRDAAELARAELWIAHGRGGALRASVERLSAFGATPLIRRRAARLLERMP